ncbi:MAG TPA: DUF1318 domain-containing protein [Syntrophorhabdaceae bacterium]|nr:DUF1318 domain-containing protein [Syntrophorhabdaceae bacterium]HQM81349.1 DUF1318 domain-containing protein [Syntrophorhabdaceae bacterium]
MLRRFRHFMYCAVFFVAACVTVNIYFPAAAIQKAADQIVDDVTGTEGGQKPEKKPDTQSRFFDSLKDVSLGPKEAYAQDINVSTPAIRNIRKSMRENFQELRPFFVRGNVGENKSGFVEIRNTSDLNLKEKADVARLVDQMNGYRTALYGEVVKANRLDSNSLPQVQKIFANSWRGKSRTGWWVQNDDGGWEKK